MANLAWVDSLQIIVSLVSVALNGILLLCNYRRGNGRWATDGILISMNAALDCVISMYMIGGTIYRLMYPSLVIDNSTWCKVSFIMERSLAISCIHLVMLLALARYIAIVNNRSTSSHVWILSAILSTTGIFAFTIYRSYKIQLFLYPSGMYCRTKDHKNNFISVTYPLFYFFITILPLVIIPYCYIRISYHYARLIRNMHMSDMPITSYIRGKNKGIIVVAIAYWFAATPHMLVFYLHRTFQVNTDATVDGLCYCFKSSVLLINAIFPILFHNEIQEKFHEFVTGKCHLLRIDSEA
ncbi:hypothetical protein DSO57_1023775 [Entomophthora muscae]|uniref:Uncharacterized protein n=1 Tax=Entomophthora muscae TaxID=34485 RepID=A0ACC2T2Z2_9FUNG|nr:hypothetical protein DSO57_1023775 [Entomophthora muscae]